MIKQRRLRLEELLGAYDALAPLYGHVPPLIFWRSWELAAYKLLSLAEPVLDIGCGDGLFFRTAFPSIREVIGVDSDSAVAAHAARTGIYRGVAVARADALPVETGSFASAFANCSIEHMDSLDSVLTEAARALRQDGIFLLSVVTDRFVSWAPLAKLLSVCRAGDAGLLIQDQHVAYHHLVNAMPVPEWRDRLRFAGFRVVEEVPIVTGAAGQAFLLLDQLWHVQRERGEFGQQMFEWMQQTPRSMSGMREIFGGLLTMSAESDDHAGVVLLARKV